MLKKIKLSSNWKINTLLAIRSPPPPPSPPSNLYPSYIAPYLSPFLSLCLSLTSPSEHHLSAKSIFLTFLNLQLTFRERYFTNAMISFTYNLCLSQENFHGRPQKWFPIAFVSGSVFTRRHFVD